MANAKSIIILLAFLSLVAAKWNGQCQQPPTYDGDCCKEGLFDAPLGMVKICAGKFNLTVDFDNDVHMTMSNIESYVCFTDCLYKAAQYLQNGTIDMTAVKAMTAARAKSVPELAAAMQKAFEICSTSVDKIIQTIKNRPVAEKFLAGKCSAYAQIMSDCVDMEYYIGCPDKQWSAAVPECEDIRAYANKCKLHKA